MMNPLPPVMTGFTAPWHSGQNSSGGAVMDW
jgi:hypothetical protein